MYIGERMKFCPIVPPFFINVFSEPTHHLLLPHLIGRNNHYTETYKQINAVKYLDNGFFENKRSQHIDTLVTKAKLVNATHIVIPDVRLTKKNRKYFRNTSRLINEEGFKSIGVVVASNYSQIVNTVNFFNLIDNIDIIAIPGQLLTTNTKIPRIQLINRLRKDVQFCKPIHLFGLDDIFELSLKCYPEILSIDSTYPFKLGYFQQKIDHPNFYEAKRPSNYFKINRLTDYQNECIRHNFDIISSLLTN
jgi:hypothetical protein